MIAALVIEPIPISISPGLQLPPTAAAVPLSKWISDLYLAGRRVKRLLANKGALLRGEIYSDGYPAILATQIGQSGGQTERVGPVSCGGP